MKKYVVSLSIIILIMVSQYVYDQNQGAETGSYDRIGELSEKLKASDIESGKKSTIYDDGSNEKAVANRSDGIGEMPKRFESSDTEMQKSAESSDNDIDKSSKDRQSDSTDTTKGNVDSSGNGKWTNEAEESDRKLGQLNKITEKELDKIKGIGPVLAKRIVDYRAAHGEFKTLEELMKIKGIGNKKYVQIKKQLK